MNNDFNDSSLDLAKLLVEKENVDKRVEELNKKKPGRKKRKNK